MLGLLEAQWAYKVRSPVTALLKLYSSPPAAAVYHPWNLYPDLVGSAGTVVFSPLLTVWVLSGTPPLATNLTV